MDILLKVPLINTLQETLEMRLSAKAEKIRIQISDKHTKLGDLRTIAKDIKRDHQLAMELWSCKFIFCPTIGNLDYGQKTSFHRID